jgi:hypothetical protein
MKTLKKNLLVVDAHNPKQYRLTPTGESLAERLIAAMESGQGEVWGVSPVCQC